MSTMTHAARGSKRPQGLTEDEHADAKRQRTATDALNDVDAMVRLYGDEEHVHLWWAVRDMLLALDPLKDPLLGIVQECRDGTTGYASRKIKEFRDDVDHLIVLAAKPPSATLRLMCAVLLNDAKLSFDCPDEDEIPVRDILCDDDTRHVRLDAPVFDFNPAGFAALLQRNMAWDAMIRERPCETVEAMYTCCPYRWIDHEDMLFPSLEKGSCVAPAALISGISRAALSVPNELSVYPDNSYGCAFQHLQGFHDFISKKEHISLYIDDDDVQFDYVARRAFDSTRATDRLLAPLRFSTLCYEHAPRFILTENPRFTPRSPQ